MPLGSQECRPVPGLGSTRRPHGWSRNVYEGTCRPSNLAWKRALALPEILQQATPAPDARYRVTSVPFRFFSLPHPRSTSCTALRLSSLPIPVCLASAVLVNVSNRYRPRRTSDARFPAPWSLPAAPASPPHTVFSRMKSLSDSFVHVGLAKGETTRLSKLGDRSPRPEQAQQPGSLGDYSRSLSGRVGQGCCC